MILDSRLRKGLACWLLAVIACVAWTWLAGRDLSRDVLDYHLYAAWHFLGDRLAQDFLGGGAQTYLNPIAGLPFYLMVRAGWNAFLIGSLLAALHALSLWSAYVIADRVLPDGMPARGFAAFAAVALAGLSPLFLMEAGTSFTDVITAVPVMAGVACLLPAPSPASSRRLFIAGLCLGIATGLKLTNAVFAVAACGLLLFPLSVVPAFARRLLVLALAGVLGFLVVEGPWALTLQREFGNPLFPMFNGWFHSPDFPGAGGLTSRFHAGGALDLLQVPFRLVLPSERLFAEVPAPDARLAMFCIVLVAWGALRLRRRASAAQAGISAAPDVPDAFKGLLAFEALAFLLWWFTSANGRYAMPMWLLLGPLVVAAVAQVARSTRAVVYSLAFMLLLQGAQMALLPQKRLAAAPWRDAWFGVQVPQPLTRTPYLYLSLDIQTGAFLFPFLDARSAFVNLVGQNSLAPGRPGGARLERLLARHAGRSRSLIPIVFRPGENPKQTLAANILTQDALLARVNLAADPADCQLLGLDDAFVPVPASPGSEDGRSLQVPLAFASCLLKAAPPIADDVRQRLAAVDRAFDTLERQCPSVFGGASPVTDDFGKAAYRRYGGDDMLLLENQGKVWLLWGWRRDGATSLGTVEDVAAGRVRLDCVTRTAVHVPG